MWEIGLRMRGRKGSVYFTTCCHWLCSDQTLSVFFCLRLFLTVRSDMGNIGGGKKKKQNGVDENRVQRHVLSESQVEAVRKTWKVVARDLQGNGVAFFVK